MGPPRAPASWRSLLVATRPWSFPASLVPAAVAVACVLPRVRSALDAVLPAAGVLLLHVFGNCINTYFDYTRGLDTASTADDRALVDRTVTAPQLLRVAGASLLLGATIISVYCWALGDPRVGALGLAGGALAFFYTADPLALKYIGLGDAVIFACFGPLLMTGVAACAVRSLALEPAVLVASVPMGALTTMILHANNARDVDADRAAGATTLAQLLGPARSRWLYAALLAAAFATTPLLWAVAARGAPGWAGRTALATGALLAACGPPAVRLLAAFAGGRLATLPQETAQFNLGFGVVVLAGLAGVGVR